MRYGLDVPNLGGLGDVHRLIELAVDAEEAGWDGFFLWDSILSHEWDRGFAEIGRNDKRGVADPWIALAAIAAETNRIRIGTMITPLTRRRPWKVARETVTLDHLSRGRLTLPVGLGAPGEAGFMNVGEELDRNVRAERLDESLAIIDGLWRGEPFAFSGSHFNVDEMTFLPRPVQQPRIPVWVVGAWPRPKSMRRTLKWDGIIPVKPDVNGEPMQMTAAEVFDVAAYVGERREQGLAGFDIVLSGQTRDAEHVRELAAAGATWWLDDFVETLQRAGVRGVRNRVRAGPPRIN